ncbi:MAG: hypothetical protein JWM56_370 [Candidatus Peribacteria bacterium]|nr:hypothetical protein [Candidatus Peribacteria bacterium]
MEVDRYGAPVNRRKLNRQDFLVLAFWAGILVMVPLLWVYVLGPFKKFLGIRRRR